MKEYTLCYLFNEGCDVVALTKVTKEAWNKGKINGIGGKVEEGEDIKDACIRELHEESGVLISDPVYFGILTDDKTYKVHLFAKAISDFPWELRFNTDEGMVKIYSISEAYYHPDLMYNLTWMLPMAISNVLGKMPFMKVVEIHEKT